MLYAALGVGVAILLLLGALKIQTDKVDDLNEKYGIERAAAAANRQAVQDLQRSREREDKLVAAITEMASQRQQTNTVTIERIIKTNDQGTCDGPSIDLALDRLREWPTNTAGAGGQGQGPGKPAPVRRPSNPPSR